MGAVQETCVGSVQSTNKHFLTIQAYPGTNSLITEVKVHSMLIFNHWVQNIEKLRKIKAECLLLPKKYQILEKNYCGEGFRLEIEYECFYIELSKEIAKRCEAEKYLEQSQMWYLVYCLASAASSCQKLGNPIGDVQPQNLYLSKEGTLKVLSKLSVPSQEDTMFGIQKTKKSLFAPQELESIRKSYKTNHLDYIVSESFSIGMTLLSAGNIQDVSDCYDYHNSSLNMLEFNKLLTFWHQNQFYSELQKKQTRYSKQLKDIVMKLVETNPQNRTTTLEIFEILLPHKDAIFSLKPFELRLDQINSSRKKYHQASNSTHLECIHQLRPPKKSKKGSSKQSEKVQNSQNFNQLDILGAFNTPIENNTVVQGSNPGKRLKIQTSTKLKMTPETFE